MIIIIIIVINKSYNNNNNYYYYYDITLVDLIICSVLEPNHYSRYSHEQTTGAIELHVMKKKN